MKDFLKSKNEERDTLPQEQKQDKKAKIIQLEAKDEVAEKKAHHLTVTQARVAEVLERDEEKLEQVEKEWEEFLKAA